MKILFFDLETTGLDPKKHGIHQISLMLEVDGEIVKEVNVNVRPFPQDEINVDALKVSGLTPEQIVGDGYYAPQSVYKSLITLLDAHCNKFNKRTRFFCVGIIHKVLTRNFCGLSLRRTGINTLGLISGRSILT